MRKKKNPPNLGFQVYAKRRKGKKTTTLISPFLLKKIKPSDNKTPKEKRPSEPCATQFMPKRSIAMYVISKRRNS